MDGKPTTIITTVTSEVTVIALSGEEARLFPGGQLRSDRLPSPPPNTAFGVMTMLDKPEPIAKRTQE
jgi:hypothetical protein